MASNEPDKYFHLNWNCASWKRILKKMKKKKEHTGRKWTTIQMHKTNGFYFHGFDGSSSIAFAIFCLEIPTPNRFFFLSLHIFGIYKPHFFIKVNALGRIGTIPLKASKHLMDLNRQRNGTFSPISILCSYLKCVVNHKTIQNGIAK